nr:2620_t:CDS:2 [Entrophospora candida]
MDLPQFFDGFKGEIFYPKKDRNEYLHKSYQYAKSSFRSIKDMNPKFVLYPKATNDDDFDDIYIALKYAQMNNLKVAIRTGGHQYTGASSTDRNNIQLDLSNTYKNFVWKHKNTELEIGISHSLDEFAKILQDKGRFLPMGQCEYVSLGGHIQTGGYGQLGRGFGLLIDYIKEIKIISYDETEKKYIAKWIKKGAELFRAVIGGSPGNFGVITHVKFNVLKDRNYSPREFFGVCEYDPGYFKKFLDIILETVDEDDFDYCVTLISDSGIEDIGNVLDNDPSYDETYNRQTYVNSGDEDVVWPTMIIIHAYHYQKYDENTSPIKKIKDVVKEPKKWTIVTDTTKKDIKVSDLVRDWIVFIRREFQLQYIKRGYFTDWEASKLIDTNWSAWVTNRVNLAIHKKLKLAAQFKYYGGAESEFYKKGVENQDKTSISWRNMNFGFTFDVFFEKEKFHLASEWQRENDKCVSVNNPIFSDKDMRLLWASHDLNLDYFHDCYYETEDKYKNLCELRDKYDPDKIFIPNNFCVGVKDEAPKEDLKNILDENCEKFKKMISGRGFTPIWKTWRGFERKVIPFCKSLKTKYHGLETNWSQSWSTAVDSAVNFGVGVGVDGTICAIMMKITFLHGMDAVVNKDHIWGVNHIGKIFYRTGSNINNGRWVEVPDGLSNVSVASDGTIWGVQIPGKFKQVYTSSEKLVVGVNYNDQIFQYVNKGWQQFDSALKNVAISIDGIVWGR